MPNPNLAAEGLTAEFLDGIRSRIHSLILPKAEAYFQEGETAYSRGRSSSKPVEIAQSYYDYQPCCVSTLSALAAEGNERALTVVRRIFDNTRTYLDGWAEWRPAAPPAVRRRMGGPDRIRISHHRRTPGIRTSVPAAIPGRQKQKDHG